MRPLYKYAAVPLVTFALGAIAIGAATGSLSGTWTGAGTLSEARATAAAALLADGRVLVTGGSGQSGALSSTEIYTPREGFTAGPGMLQPRSGHAAVTLADGRVLVTGGAGAGGVAANTAELFDPRSGAWVALTETMTEARAGHAATLLDDGKVLLAGGESSGGVSSSIEIFDPATGRFSTAGVMASPRRDHAAVLLGDGRVAIAGGFDGHGPLASIDLFDPATGSLTLMMMGTARSRLSATTLLDGSVLLAGGRSAAGDLASAEILNPATETVTAAANLARPRSGHLAFRLPNNNAVLLAGGTNEGAPLRTADLYLPWSRSSAATGTLDVARVSAAGAPLLAPGQVLVASGAGASQGEIYHFATIQSDKDDYAPGAPVTITGHGWQPGETVTLVLREAPLLDEHPALTAIADADGNFVNSEFAPDEHDINVRFYVTGTGAASQAQTTFTDAVNTDTAISSSLNPSNPADSVTFTATVTEHSGGALVTVGNVSFRQGSNNTCTAGAGLATVSLNASGQASFTKVFPAGGSFDVCARYNGSGSGPTALSESFGTITQTVRTPTTLAVASASGTYGGTTTLSATLMAGANPVSGRTIAFSVNGTSAGSANTNNAGVATLSGASLSGLIVGTYSIDASFATDGSFLASNGTGSLSVTRRPITATADAKTKAYGDADPALTYQITSGSLVGTDTLSGALTRVAGEAAGTYAIQQGTLAATSNYTLTFVGANLTITRRPITVTADAKTKIYGDPDPPLTYQITSGNLIGTDALTGALTRAGGDNVGTRQIQQGTLTAGANYNLTFVGATLTISPRPIIVTANAGQTKVYGAADPSLTYQITSGNLVGTDAITGALTRAPGEDVGTYAIQQGTLTAGSNYAITFVGANFTITPRPVTVTADSGQTKVYGDSDPTLTYQITAGSLLSGDHFSGALGRASGENVGTYAIQQATLTAGSNYAITFDGANFAITPRPLNVKADGGQTKVYGNPDPTLTYHTTGMGLVAGDSFTGSLTRAAGENVGSYAIQQGTLAASSNYTLTFTGATFTITARPITVTADAKTKQYGDSDPPLTYTLTSGSLVAGDALSGALARVAGENVGSYAIQQGTLAAPSNYALTFAGANLSITPRAITISADPKTKQYGDADPPLTYSLTSGSLASGDTLSGALSRAPGDSVGSYAILQGTLNPGTNYTLTYAGANLTVTPRPITVTAEPKTKPYGDADPELTYQLTAGTLVTGDGFSGALTRAAGENVGTYAIQQGTLAVNANYAITYVGANLTITPREVTVTADPKTKTYGDADAALTYQLTSGSLAPGNSFSGALTRAAGENVGTYAIQLGTLTAGPNYNLQFIGADLTITHRPITVTADAKSKVYGNADPPLTYQITTGSLAFSDVFSGALTRAAGENVGGYPIQQGSLALNANYNLTFVGATLTITPRPITVTTDPKSKVYGYADPPLTYQITSGSLAFSDAFSGALTRVAGENVGVYGIGQGTLALTVNYALTFVGANFTITLRPITVTADAKTKFYGDPDPPLTYQITSGSLVNGDGFTGALARVAGENVGSYAIQQGTLSAGANYALTFIGANLSIIWSWSNVLQPVNVDGSSAFKFGSTVPVKFRLTGASAAVTTLAARLTVAKLSNGVFASEMEPISTSAADVGNTFRYDPTERQYIFNLATKPLSQGTWQLSIDLGDGVSHTVVIGLVR